MDSAKTCQTLWFGLYHGPRILNDVTIKPHKVDYWCGKSQDPEFEEKQAAILGLYMEPPDNALVFTVDEKSQNTSFRHISTGIAIETW